ncbi:hypothetical protein ACHAWU_006207 [Discostella pseudostelligera]|uniref:RING-type domain-containing protein n=1 Tax=Discostella pseudostelligera TaxID=259834 RepID=A0ABD3MWD5_9STRA
MSSSLQAAGGVIDLSLDLDSSVSPPPIDRRRRAAPTPPQQQQKRYPTRKRGLIETNAVGSSNNADKSNGGVVDSAKLASREVIVLGDDNVATSISPNLKPPSLSPNTLTRSRRGRRRRLDEDDDDDDIEIISPSTSAAAAAAAATTKMKGSDAKLLSGDKYWIERIREAFPYYPRAEIATYLSSARSYVSTTVEEGDDKDECAFRTVMTVLAEEGIKSSASMIPDARFAAAAIGGRIEISDSNFSSAAASSPSSRRKTALLECQCCFVEYDFKVMVPCRSGHLFCMECLRKHTEQRVFGNGNFGSVGVQQRQQLKTDQRGTVGKSSEDDKKKALEILCMASDCVSGFDDRVLTKALPKKVLDRYDELRFKANIERANMPDVSTCPKCNFTAAIVNNHAGFHKSVHLPPTHLLFHCPECHFKSCRLCHEEYHPNIPRCDLVESQTETSGRNAVEEAMTSALIRICPRSNCRKKFLKTDGCNKMTCPCGCLVCNICRVEIPATVGYLHFCQTPHCNHAKCAKCPLWADSTASDAKRIANAAKEAAKSVLKTQSVNVDVESLLKCPPSMNATFGRKR